MRGGRLSASSHDKCAMRQILLDPDIDIISHFRRCKPRHSALTLTPGKRDEQNETPKKALGQA